MDVLHTSFFCTMSIDLYSLVLARNNSIYPLLVPVWTLYPQPLLYVFSNLIIPKSFPTDGISDGRNEVAKWWSKTWWVGKNSPSRVSWLGTLFSNACAVVLCRAEGRFQQYFVRSGSSETHLQGFEIFNVLIWANSLSTWHNVYQNYPLLHPPKTEVVTFPYWRGSIKLLQVVPNNLVKMYEMINRLLRWMLNK
jgi:hypothetical protein